jgi:spore germination protein YaaH
MIKGYYMLFLFILFSNLAFGQNLVGPHAEQANQFRYLAKDLSLDKEFDYNEAIEPLVQRSTSQDRVVFGYHPYWEGSAYQQYDWSKLTHIAYFGVEMDQDGNLTNSHSWPVSTLINMAHTNGVKVILTVTNFSSSQIGSIIGSATNRQRAITNLVNAVSAGSADGVNVDFEFVPSSGKQNFNTFMNELTQAFHSQIPGSEVSIAMPSVDWSNAYDYNYLSDHCDGLMIMAYGYSWGGSSTAGPISPLNSGFFSHYIKVDINTYLNATGGDPSQLILGLPWYGFDWPVSSTSMLAPTTGTGSAVIYSTAVSRAASYGKNYNNDAPSAWYQYSNASQLHQAWYDDATSLEVKYQYAVDENLKGIGIWALGYDGNRDEIWMGLNILQGNDIPPNKPSGFIVRNLGGNLVQILADSVQYADEYHVYHSFDALQFDSLTSSSTRYMLLQNLTPDVIHYFKIKTSNQSGSSGFTEILATVPKVDASKVLVVNGFERIAGTVNNLDYIKEHGPSILEYGLGFDAASNDAVANGVLPLTNYSIVDWISGEEGSVNTTFSSEEQIRIQEYLESGGAFLASGSEIGYDLVEKGSISDVQFFQNYFKANYVTDNTQSYGLKVGNAGIFDGIGTLSFDNGQHGSYDVDYPDGIRGTGGAIASLAYDNVNASNVGYAGIQYSGTFGNADMDGAIVYVGVGLETIYPDTSRHELFARILEFLETNGSISPETPSPNTLSLYTLYPNPTIDEINIDFESAIGIDVTVRLFDILGRQRYTESLRTFDILTHRILNFNQLFDEHMAAGLYFIQLSSGDIRTTQKFTYLPKEN